MPLTRSRSAPPSYAKLVPAPSLTPVRRLFASYNGPRRSQANRRLGRELSRTVGTTCEVYAHPPRVVRASTRGRPRKSAGKMPALHTMFESPDTACRISPRKRATISSRRRRRLRLRQRRPGRHNTNLAGLGPTRLARPARSTHIRLSAGTCVACCPAQHKWRAQNSRRDSCPSGSNAVYLDAGALGDLRFVG